MLLLQFNSIYIKKENCTAQGFTTHKAKKQYFSAYEIEIKKNLIENIQQYSKENEKVF